MGIKGLMTYVTNDRLALEPYKLRQSQVIIDGNNLIHSIHMTNFISWKFGGEYDKLAKSIRKFFNLLFACQLKPFVVLDGCYNIEEAKLKTVLQRFKERLFTCDKLNKNSEYKGLIFPMLMLQTMLCVMDEMNVSYVTCHGEADREIAALANLWNCPVVSNDSDFFIFPLKSGFIPVNTVNFVESVENCDCCESGSHSFLSCKIYMISKYSFKIGGSRCTVNGELMPLFATIAGNDFVDDVLFSKFHRYLSIIKLKLGAKFVPILKWLHDVGNVKTAVEKLLVFSKEESRARLRKIVTNSLSQYDLSNSVLVAYVSNDLTAGECQAGPVISLSQLPPFVLHRLRRHLLSPILLNSVVTGKVFLLTYVELINDKSVHEASKLLRSRFYSTLAKLSPGFQSVIEYTRKQGAISKESIEIKSFSIQQNPPLLISSHLDFLKVLFGEWATNCLRDRMIAHALLAATLLQYSWQDRLRQPDSDFQKEQYSNPLHKYFANPLATRLEPYRMELVQAFNQLQSVAFTLSQLFFLDPEANESNIPSPQSLFCGRLFYNLAQLCRIKKHKNWRQFCDSLFQQTPCDNFADWHKKLSVVIDNAIVLD